MGMTKLVVEVVAEQEATVAMFTQLGFEPEGLLKDHVRSQSGRGPRPARAGPLRRGAVGDDARRRASTTSCSATPEPD